ncbi:MAG: HD domain-containing phosphohydrolase [bacterium]
MTERILFVDDDPNILDSFKRTLSRHYNLETALGGETGLAKIQNNGPFAVIVSDMRMPQMDGVSFLTKAREKTPDSVRILLSGHADLNDAIAVVNRGYIFRFLTKPCPNEIITKALDDAVKQYRLIISERELLEKTLQGSVKVLADILSIVSPDAFSRSTRIRKVARQTAKRLNMSDLWEIELAALLSQIGCVTIPGDILRKKYQGQALSVSEREMFLSHVQVGDELIANIPRLEKIAEAISYQEKRFDGGGPPKDFKKGREIPLISRILKVVLDFDTLVAAGRNATEALDELQTQSEWYDPDVLAALSAEVLSVKQGFVVRTVTTQELKRGMILAADVRTNLGVLLVPKGHEISELQRIRLMNFAQNGHVKEPIKVLELIQRSNG